MLIKGKDFIILPLLFLYNIFMFNSYEEFNVAKSRCNICSIGKVYNTVVCSDGCKSNPLVLVIGEAAGSEEVEQGKPFIGKAGKLLRPILNEFGFRKSNTLISNVIPCRPKDNQFPKDDELVKACFEKWLKNEILITNPKYLLLVGSQPLKFILGHEGITRIRGDWYNFSLEDRIIETMPTYHPSFVLRKMYMDDGKKIMGQFRDDIKEVARKAGFQ